MDTNKLDLYKINNSSNCNSFIIFIIKVNTDEKQEHGVHVRKGSTKLRPLPHMKQHQAHTQENTPERNTHTEIFHDNERKNNWRTIKITEKAQEIIPLKEHTKDPWWDSDCDEALENRIVAYRKYSSNKKE